MHENITYVVRRSRKEWRGEQSFYLDGWKLLSLPSSLILVIVELHLQHIRLQPDQVILFGESEWEREMIRITTVKLQLGTLALLHEERDEEQGMGEWFELSM